MTFGSNRKVGKYDSGGTASQLNSSILEEQGFRSGITMEVILAQFVISQGFMETYLFPYFLYLVLYSIMQIEVAGKYTNFC